MTKIEAGWNGIGSVRDEDVVGLDSLQMLDLSHNRLEDIPESIMMLPKLRELNLASNRLKKLADGIIAVWPSLLKIDLS